MEAGWAMPLNGTLVVGQEQDLLGGGFDLTQVRPESDEETTKRANYAVALWSYSVPFILSSRETPGFCWLRPFQFSSFFFSSSPILLS